MNPSHVNKSSLVKSTMIINNSTYLHSSIQNHPSQIIMTVVAFITFMFISFLCTSVHFIYT